MTICSHVPQAGGIQKEKYLIFKSIFSVYRFARLALRQHRHLRLSKLALDLSLVQNYAAQLLVRLPKDLQQLKSYIRKYIRNASQDLIYFQSREEKRNEGGT